MKRRALQPFFKAEKLISRAVKELEQQLDSSHLLTLVAATWPGHRHCSRAAGNPKRIYLLSQFPVAHISRLDKTRTCWKGLESREAPLHITGLFSTSFIMFPVSDGRHADRGGAHGLPPPSTRPTGRS